MRSRQLIRGTFALVLASVAGACFSLEALAPFPCAKDASCPRDFYCDASSSCVSCTIDPSSGNEVPRYCYAVSPDPTDVGCDPSAPACPAAQSCAYRYASDRWDFECQPTFSCGTSTCATGEICMACNASGCVPAVPGACSVGGCSLSCYQGCDFTGHSKSASLACASGKCSPLDGVPALQGDPYPSIAPGPVINGVWFGFCKPT